MRMDVLEGNLLFTLAALGFLVLAVVGGLVVSWIDLPSQRSLAVYLGGVVLVNFGYIIGKTRKWPNLMLPLGVAIPVLLALFLWRMHGWVGVVAAPVLFLILLLVLEAGSGYGGFLCPVGMWLFAVSLWTRGVPLLEPAVRAQGYDLVWAVGLIAYLIGINMVAETEKRWLPWLVAGVVVFALGGYRSAIILIVLSSMITRHLAGKLDWKKARWGLGALVLVVLLVGQMNAFAGGGDNMLKLVVRRAGFTYERFDQAVNTLSPVDRPGSLWIAREPRLVIGMMTVLEAKIINAGIFGHFWLDGGILEVIFGSLAVGAFLGRWYKGRMAAQPYYGMMLIYLLVAVEAGMDFVYLVGMLSALFALGVREKLT